MTETKMWGIHAGKYGEAHEQFIKNNVIALEWEKIDNLSKIPPDREAFKKAVIDAYPGKKPGAIPVEAGQLYRFVYEIQKGDFVVYPSKKDKKIYIGKIESDYKYNSSWPYPHYRKVKWIKSFPRTFFSQGALYEIGSAMSFFQVKNYADEFIAVLEGKTGGIAPPIEEEQAGIDPDEIEQLTKDYIIKKLLKELKGHPFAEFVAHLLRIMGYKTRVSPEGPDGGVDIIAHKDELGFEPPIIKVQVKSTEGSVGDPVTSALYGKVGEKEHGLIVALGTFTKQAKTFAQNKHNLRLIDGNELVDLILEHYEKLDSKYKSIIPLKKVYIPESIQEEE